MNIPHEIKIKYRPPKPKIEEKHVDDVLTNLTDNMKRRFTKKLSFGSNESKNTA